LTLFIIPAVYTYLTSKKGVLVKTAWKKEHFYF
jgi:hypothetical protein